MKETFFRRRTHARFMTAGVGVLAAIVAAGCSSEDGAATPEKTCTLSEALVSRPSARLLLTASTLQRLKARAAAGDPEWTELKTQCDAMTKGTVHAPNGTAYPGGANVGSGYQGETYLPAILTMGLCYRVAQGTDAAAEAAYGAAGARILEAMSTPVAQGGLPPSTNSGYPIRNFGVGMAYGYDWLYPALSAGTRQRVIASLNTWVDWYDTAGFLRNDPIGNYFAGYFLAKTATALATEGENPKAAEYFQDVEGRLWGKLVKPAFEKTMAGGGWPEGWGYGPKAVRSVLEVLWAAKTAKNLDWQSELPIARDQARYIANFTWPSLEHMDDLGTVRSGNEIAPSAALASEIATVLHAFGDPAAGAARSYASSVIAKGDDRKPWEKFLFWDASLPAGSHKDQGLSYYASGPGHVAMRSSWDADASWGAFTSGAYINALDSGEQMFNQGSLSVVVGDDPVLVNATGYIPKVAGTAGENFVYEDTWQKRTRTLYNTFFVADPANPYSPGQGSMTPDQATTRVERYDEAGGYVRARGADIHQMYRSPAMKQFSRDVVYVRPGTYVLFDRTTVEGGHDQWMAFHTPKAPTAAATADATQKRFDVTNGGGQPIGSIRTLLPRNVSAKTVSLPGGVTRIEAHATGATQQWLSVVTTSAAAPEQVRLSGDDGNVAAGNVVGVHVKGARGQVVLFPGEQADTSTIAAAKYTVAQGGDADHVLVDVAPSGSGYSATAVANGGGLTVELKAGGALKPTAQGTLCYTVSSSGAVTSCPFKAPVPGTGAQTGTVTTPETGTGTTPAPSGGTDKGASAPDPGTGATPTPGAGDGTTPNAPSNGDDGDGTSAAPGTGVTPSGGTANRPPSNAAAVPVAAGGSSPGSAPGSDIPASPCL